MAQTDALHAPADGPGGKPDLVVKGSCLAASILAMAHLTGRRLLSSSIESPEPVAMNLATAISVLLLSACVWMKRRSVLEQQGGLPTSVLLAATAVAVGAVFSSEFGAGRLVPSAALCLLLLGAAVMLLDGPLRRATPYILAACGLVLTLTVAGYLYRVLPFYHFPGGYPMGLNTAVALLLLCIGVACLRPEREPASILFSRSTGGAAARWLLPAALGVPMLLEKLRQIGQERGLYSFETGAALCVVGCVAALSLLTWWTARVIHYLDLQRTQAEARFSAFMNNSPAVAFIKDERGRYVFVNQKFCAAFELKREQLIGRTSEEVMASSGRALLTNETSVLRTGRAVEFTERVAGQDGTGRDWLAFNFPVTDENGRRCLGGVAVDITERRRYQEELADAERFVRATLDALQAQIAILDETGTVLAANRSWEEFGRLHGGQDGFRMAVGGNYLAYCDGVKCRCALAGCPGTGGCWVSSASAVAEGIRAVLRGERDEFQTEYDWSCRARRSFVMHVTRFNDEGPARVVMAHEDVTARRQAEEHVRHQALHDGLTDLPNRVMIQRQIAECVARAGQDPDFRFAVLFMDLDRFKVVNDSLGHGLGDRLLVAVADRIEQCVQASIAHGCRISRHMIARMGGDEFIILLERIGEETDAARVAGRIVTALNVPFQVDFHEVLTTVSIGVAGTAVRYGSADDVIRDADAAMYRAKMAGKGRYVIFDESMHAAAVDRLQLEGELRRCVENRELRLHYQPIVSLCDGRICGFEALVRWQHPDRGLLCPADFIPLAEETGMIGIIGEWVLRSACQQLRRWQERFPMDPPLTMSANLSGRQLASPGLPARLASVLNQTGIDPGTLRLEITEGMMIENEAALEILSKIKELGIRLHMDDFGTGYSALGCLHRFPLDGMKIDRMFVMNADRESSHRAVLEAMAGLTRRLGMKMVVEGVETESQATLLRELNCEHAQGYLFSSPLEPGMAAALLRSARPASGPAIRPRGVPQPRPQWEEVMAC
jgi:diguanylate cyclase (GGDEF)-like protein/PAS domain S-box-containing protein